MVVNGDLTRIASIVTGGSVQVATPNPVPVPVAALRPVPVAPAASNPVPVAPSGSCSNIKYGDVPTNNYYVAVYGATGSNTVAVTCLNNVKVNCIWNSAWGRHTCSTNIECKVPRSAVVNGLSCPLNPLVIAARMEEDTPATPIPSWGIALIVVGSVACICAVVGATFYFTRPAPEERV
jgi:hypothetical protein